MQDASALELRLRDIEARYHGLLKSAGDGIVITDALGVIEVYNPGAERIFGYPEDEVLGRSVSMLIPLRDSLHHALFPKSRSPSHEARLHDSYQEVEGRHKTGEIFPIDLSVKEIATPGGAKFVGIARDISRRKVAEAAVIEQREETRFIIDHAPVGTFSADLEGRLQSVNPAFLELTGEPVESLLGRPVGQLFEEGWRGRVGMILTQVVEEGRQRRLSGIELVCAEGRRAWVNLHLDRLDHAGEPDRLLGHVVDRTAEREAYAIAERMRQEASHVARLSTLGEMATAIAHEVNQPLTAIASQAQAWRRLLRNGRASMDEIANGLELIAEQALQVGLVVKRVRAFVTKREIARELVDLNQLLGQVVDLADLEARRDRVRLEIMPDLRLPALTGDSIQIQQVLLNLIRNAIEACRASEEGRRKVTVDGGRRGDQLIITVSDTGPGVAEAQKQKLFLPFFTTKPEGVGLGLSLSSSIVEAHGGALSYRDNPDGGAVFEVSLPVTSADGFGLGEAP